MTSSVDGRQMTHAETLIAKANESRTSTIGAPVSQQGKVSANCIQIYQRQVVP